MYYLLDSQIALRSWWHAPYACYTWHKPMARHLTKEEFEFLSHCDGETELPESSLSESLCTKGLCHPVQKGEAKLTDWQKPLFCDNRYMPTINWMITGRCNYNCLHCFNAADNTPLQSEFSMEEAEKLLDEARACGVNGFTITGGEPMLHKGFLDILKGICSRGMYVFELNTNGFYLTQDMLDEMKRIDCRPIIKISFDGIGCHDRMRGMPGAEADALRAIRLCVENGFETRLQVQMNRMTLPSILPTLLMADQMGVSSVRVLRTSEAPRWLLNAPEQSFPFDEYYTKCLHIAEQYIRSDCRASVDLWQFMTVYPDQKAYLPRNALHLKKDWISQMNACQLQRNMISIAADGEVYPCIQESGFCVANGIHYGNVKTDSLQSLLRYSPYMRECSRTVGEILQINTTCRDCPYLTDCGGGCRALAQITDGSLTGRDKTKCLYYQNGYPQKIKEALSGYRDLSES